MRKPIAIIVLAGLAAGCGVDEMDFDFHLGEGTGLVQSLEVSVHFTRLSGPAPEEVRIWEDGEAKPEWTAYSEEMQFTLRDQEGTHKVWAQTGSSGRQSKERSATVVLDTTGPSVALLNLLDGQTQPPGAVTVRVKAEDANGVQQVQVFADSEEQEAVLQGDDEYEATVSIHEYENLISGVATDLAGNQGSTQITVIGHTTSPLVTVTYPAHMAYLPGTDVVVTGTVDDPDAPQAQLTVNGDNSPWFDVQAGEFSWPVQLVEGQNTLEARAEDSLGRVGRSGSLAVMVDTQAPSDVSATLGDGAPTVPAPNVDVHLEATDESSLEVALTNTGTIQESDWRAFDPLIAGWELGEPDQEGPKTVRVQVRDAAGNASDTLVLQVGLDLNPPLITLLHPTPGTVTEATSLRLQGTVEEVSDFTLVVLHNGQPLTPLVQGSFFEVELPLVDGENLTAVTATDTCGRESLAATLTLRRVDSLPDVVILSPADGTVTGLASLTVSGVVDDPAVTLVALLSNGLEAASAVPAGGQFSAEVPLEAGENTLTATCVNPDGIQATSPAVTVFRDVEPPDQVAVLINGGVDVVSGLDVTLTFAAEDLSPVEVMVSNQADFAGASWQSLPAEMPWTLLDSGGELTVYARFQDSWGNGPVETSAGASLDADPPAILSFSHNAAGPLSLGDVLHLSMEVDEPGGEALADLGAVHPGIRLYDDGTHGDATSGDGVFERDYPVGFGDQTSGSVVTGHYQDRAGNPAPPATATGLVIVNIEPVVFTIGVDIQDICTSNIDDTFYDDAFYRRAGIRAPPSGNVTTYPGTCKGPGNFGPPEFWSFSQETGEALTVVVEGWDHDDISSDDSLGAATATVPVSSEDYDFDGRLHESASSGYFRFHYKKTVWPYLVSSTHPDEDTEYPGDQATFAWQAPPCQAGVEGYAYSLDPDPAGEPPPGVMTTDDTVTLENLSPGTHYFHLMARDGLGQWSPVATRTVRVAGK